MFRKLECQKKNSLILSFPFLGKLCIEVTPQSKIAWISETLCIGCGICIKVSDIYFSNQICNLKMKSIMSTL